jgi:acetolactate decarboxylase
MLQKGDLSACIYLDALSEIPHLYAIGPIEGLKGEITVYDGQSSIATIERALPTMSSSWEHGAIFLGIRECFSVADDDD